MYDNLFVCIKFADYYSGYQFFGAWTEANSGGTPLKNTAEANALWAENPQYLMELKKDSHVFISLGQPDQRLIPGEVYPFSTLPHALLILTRGPQEEHDLHLAPARARVPPLQVRPLSPCLLV